MTGRLPPIGSTEPWSGGRAGPSAFCILAPNPSVMTLDGTNTWLVGEPGSGRRIIVDPGPDDPAHLRAIAAELERQDCAAVLILLTHGHLDHSEGAGELARRLGVPVRALDPEYRMGAEGLSDGDVIEAAGVEVAVVATPGHTADSMSFHLRNDDALLTGDTVLGRGTTVVAHPDGRLDAYLSSLRRLQLLAAESGAGRVLPGHGPALDDPVGLLAAYVEHREQRLDQVRQAVAAGAETAQDVVELVYADVPRAAWPAARLSVAAQLEYLREYE